MKSLITGLTFVLLLMMFNVFQIDHDVYLRAQDNIKYLADDSAAAGALYYDESRFSEGYKRFNYSRSEDSIRNLISLNLNLDHDQTPSEESLFSSKVQWRSYYFDDTMHKKTYLNGVLQKNEAFIYNSIFTDEWSGYKKLITEPTLIVTIKTSAPKNRSRWLMWPDIVRSSAYENLDWN